MMGPDAPEEQVPLFAGEPYTTLGHDEQGRTTASVQIYALSPERVKTCQALATLTICVLVVLAFASANPALFFGSFLLFFAHGVITQKFANHLTQLTTVSFTPAEFKVLRRGRWYVYNRTIKHSIALIEHDNARVENEQRQLAIAKAQLRREAISPQRIYGQSFHLVYLYYGQRHDIASIYGEQTAKAVVARLQAVDALMDSQLKMGDAPVRDPREQWDDGDRTGAGDLP